MLTAHGTQEMPVWYRCSGRGAMVHESEMQRPSPTCLGTSNRSRQSEIRPTLAPGPAARLFPRQLEARGGNLAPRPLKKRVYDSNPVDLPLFLHVF